MRKKLWLLLGGVAAFVALLFVLKYSSLGDGLVSLASNGGAWLLPIVALAALLDSINPCAFSVLLITIAFLFNLGKPRREVLALGASYIAGLFVVYLFIGLGLLQALNLFGIPNFMGRLGAAAIIVFGILNLLGYLFPHIKWLPGIPQSMHQKMATLMEKVSLPAVFLVGALVALCEFPCTGGPYLLVLGLLHDTATYFKGFWYLIFYNILFVSPLILILLVASQRELLEKVSAWKHNNIGKAKLWIGGLMVALGIIIIFFV
ncbi:MAG: hypothetical protein UX81_C0009G0014 [Parcubacteria group bacterium GW2011_GWA2_47_12]|nr:MAG: hypothetical protein UX81_C0009G0014 [Parcubacteria group bacterium GW2011_GWA2_47_12]